MATYSNATNTTTYSSAIRTKWKQDLLDTAEGMLVADRFATTDIMGRGEGGTLKLNKVLRQAKVTSSDAEGLIVTGTDAKALSSNYIDIVPSFWGDSFAFSDKQDIVSFITDPKNRDVVANQLARTMDYQTIKIMSTQGMRHRIDKDGTYQVSGTADSGSTTTLVDDALTQIDDHWNGGYLTSTSAEGVNYDVTRKVSDFVASSDTVTTAAFNQANATSTKYRMTVGTGIVAGDKMTSTGLLDVNGLHTKLETPRFEGAIYRGFLDAAQERDLWDDSTWINSAINDDSQRLQNYKLIRWLGMEFLISSELYREDADGTENQSTGVVYVAPIFGKDSYSIVRWGMGQGDYGVDWHVVDTPDSGNLRMGAKFLSWKAHWGGAVTRSTSMIGLMTGATSQNIVV